jgi:hypothetical protein
VNTIKPLIILLIVCSFAFSIKVFYTASSEYLPVNSGCTLVYESSFGDCLAKYYQKNNFIVSTSAADKFQYKQTFMVQDSGVYTVETYQYLKVLPLIKKESMVTYKTPLLRFPLPLSAGLKWHAEGSEYNNGEEARVKVSGTCFGKETVQTLAGNFEAMKIQTIVEGSNGSHNTVTEWWVKNIGLVKANIVIEGGGMMGTLRDFLGYGTLEFNLKEIRKN